MNKKVLAGVAGTMILATGIYLKTTYQVDNVIDGDTFETKEHQIIRLNGVDAPELNNCGGKEAKLALENLILNKRLQIKIVYIDGYRRLISHVYAGNKNISLEMLKKGWAYRTAGMGVENKEFNVANDHARSGGIGIFGEMCTQKINIKNPNCDIKANVNIKTEAAVRGEKTYYYPGCHDYVRTIVQLYVGDNWFCTRADAEKAGFKKAERCP